MVDQQLRFRTLGRKERPRAANLREIGKLWREREREREKIFRFERSSRFKLGRVGERTVHPEDVLEIRRNRVPGTPRSSLILPSFFVPLCSRQLPKETERESNV